METKVLAKFGSGSMKEVKTADLQAIGITVGPKGGGVDPRQQVLIDWLKNIIKLAQKNLLTGREDGKDVNAKGTLSASLDFDPIPLTAEKIAVNLLANPYWKFVDQGVRGTISSTRAPNSPFSFKKKGGGKSDQVGPMTQAIADWITDKGILVTPTYSREKKAMRTVEEQKLADARSITYFVRRRGLYATKFLTNALTPEQIDLLVNTISEVLGKQVSLSTSR